MSLPSTQTAAIVPDVGQALQIKNNHPVPKPEDLKPGQCIVKISHTGVCHTDLHAKKGDWPVKPMNPLVGGHEGVGTVVAVKEGDVGPVKVGDRVGIKWLADSCLDCEFCRRGFEMNCPNAKLSGYTTDGTFSQYVLSYTHHVTPIPSSLQPADAASILCAGLTTYKALKVSNTKVGDWICIPGAGGGLGHLAVQYAKTMGLKVIAVDTGDEKRELVEKLGADKWIDFREGDLVSEIRKASGGLGVHAAVVAAASADAYSQAVQYLREGGTLVCVGMIDKSMEMTSFWTVYKSLRIQGSYVGNRQDAIEALDIAADGKVKVHYVLKKLKDLKDVYEDLEAGKISGRVVLEVDE